MAKLKPSKFLEKAWTLRERKVRQEEGNPAGRLPPDSALPAPAPSSALPPRLPLHTRRQAAHLRLRAEHPRPAHYHPRGPGQWYREICQVSGSLSMLSVIFFVCLSLSFSMGPSQCLSLSLHPSHILFLSILSVCLSVSLSSLRYKKQHAGQLISINITS